MEAFIRFLEKQSKKNNQSLNSCAEEGKILSTLCLPYILYGSKQMFKKDGWVLVKGEERIRENEYLISLGEEDEF